MSFLIPLILLFRPFILQFRPLKKNTTRFVFCVSKYFTFVAFICHKICAWIITNKNSVLRFVKVSSTNCGGVKSGKTVLLQETRCFSMLNGVWIAAVSGK